MKELILVIIISLLSSLGHSQTLSVLTYNVWDVGPVGGEFTEDRHAAICDLLRVNSRSEEGWDVVFIQEIWPLTKANAFSDCGYPFQASVDKSYEESESNLSWLTNVIFNEKIDTGLRVLAKYPLVLPLRHTYSINGTWRGIADDGDILANKSAMSAILKHPTLGSIQLINTHLVSRGTTNSNEAQRVQQLIELKSFYELINQGLPTIIAGDFNVGPIAPGTEPDSVLNSLETWELLTNDLFAEFQHAAQGEYLCTYCPSTNKFSKEIDQSIDHIFVSKDFEVLHVDVVMRQSILTKLVSKAGDDFKQIPLSDHYGVESVLELK